MVEQIRKISVQNFKGLRDIEITIHPGQSMVEIAGENGQGKSSVLDAIETGFRGAKSAPEKALRIGSDEGHIIIETESFRLTRKIDENGIKSLKVERLDTNAPVGKPQSFLDEFYGEFSLDPIRFKNLSKKNQAETLVSLMNNESRDALLSIDIDLKNTEEERLALSRDLKRVGIPPRVEKAEPVDLSELLKQQQEAIEFNAVQDRRERILNTAKQNIVNIEDKIEDLKKKLRELMTTLEAEKSAREQYPTHETKIDISEISTKISGTSERNAQAVKYQNYLNRIAEREEIERKHKKAEAKIRELREDRIALFESAKLPINGAMVTEDGIFVRGKPFGDLCTKEQILGSAVIAMALSPKLRVLLIREGSLLDKTSWEALENLVNTRGYQIWSETVGDGHGEAIILSEGRIAE